MWTRGSKLVSPLDLKLMDVKFMKLQEMDGHSELKFPQRKHAYVKSSISSTINTGRESLEDSSIQNLETDIDSLTKAIADQKRLLEVQESKRKSECRLTSQSKLKSRILQLRVQNDDIHRKIKCLYQPDDNVLADNVKRIAKVKQFHPSPQNKPNNRKTFEVQSYYDNLRKNSQKDLEYMRKIQQLKSKITGSMVHKKFEEYLVRQKIRIPMFIKELNNQ